LIKEYLHGTRQQHLHQIMLPFFSFFGIFALSTIVVATEAEIKGIIPTASGQIGVNPVDLPPASVL
jgi:hypothetical protein